MLGVRDQVIASTLPVNSNQVIYVYSDHGVSATSLIHTRHMLKSLAPSYRIELIDAQGIVHKDWPQDAALFIMPGGADVPYTQQLSGEGNTIIQHYVENGGSYLGICAGAYYSAGFVEFDKNGPLEVVEERALKFFPGKAIGPILAPYDDATNQGARVASLRINWQSPIKQAIPSILPVYYNGGGYFETTDAHENVRIVASYQLESNDLLPAILKIQYQQGTVILSGVHFEYSAHLLKKDQYHEPLIPLLKSSENDRRLFARTLLASLGVNTAAESSC
ncbi:MAG: BPL-N domain-containing protein [Bacteroidota bacterium]